MWGMGWEVDPGGGWKEEGLGAVRSIGIGGSLLAEKDLRRRTQIPFVVLSENTATSDWKAG